MAQKLRAVTNQIFDAVDAGELSWEQVARGALQYMSESDVAEMAHNEELFLNQDDDDDTDGADDFFEDFNSVGSRHHY